METEVINQKVSYEIAHLYMGVITVMVGPVPVVMDLEMPLSVNLEGKVSVGVSTSFSQTNSLTAGLKYQNQEWTPVAVYQKEFRFEPPHLTAGVEIRGYIDVPLEINLYHVAGPYVSVQPYLSLKAAAGEDPWWSLKGGLDARAGFSMEILGHSLANHSQNVIQSSTTLAQAPYNPSPAVAASGIDLDTTLSWAMDGLNKDQFTYNVFLEAGETAPDVQVATRQTGTSFTPATLEEDKTYYWQVVPVNSLGQELPPGPVWSFTTTHPAEPGDMGFIPAGTFRMGCNGCEYDQDPVHTVYLDAYWIDVFEVTNSQYSGCVSSGNCEPPLSYDSSSHSSYYDNATYANYPVIRVSWYDAVDYCGWLGKRLPTEAEWEKAARGPNDLRQYPWGTGLPNCSLANMYCIHDTREVGATPNGASPYGIQDMLGNVQEWTNDWYLKDYYETSPAENPQGPAGGTLKVMRGGSWGSAFDKTYITLRFSLYGEPVSHGYGMGFRCAASAGE
jgi:formylglycine-generating enzyme required for sulfatase activity